MDRDKARYLVTNDMQGLWPRWNMTWQIQEAWTNMLAKHSEADARKAIHRVFSEGRSSVQPFPNEFGDAIRKISAARGIPISNGYMPPPPPPPYVMMCKEGGPVGAMQVMWGCEKWPLDKKDEWLTGYRKKFEQHYGGKWIILQNPTWASLRELRHELMILLPKRKAAEVKVVESKPLADILPEAYEDTPDIQENLDDYTEQEHDSNKLFREDKKKTLPF